MSERREPSVGAPAPDARLEEISTYWSLFRLAHQGTGASASAARNALVMRYNGAIHRYLAALLHNEQEAQEVTQEVVVRLLRGDFAAATPERGRFRDYLKAAVRNEYLRYVKKKGRRAAVSLEVLPSAANTFAEWLDDPQDPHWLAEWRRDVLAKTMRVLQSYERETEGNLYHTLMRLRTEHLDDDNSQLAQRVLEETGRAFSPEAFRGQLLRARRKFAELLLEHIAATLDQPTPENVEAELSDLGLLGYVRDLFPADRRNRGQRIDPE
ncbi:MAG: sigma-70 family RNA polymerase sigma factor [Planctomycetes bacterium]|nr:sigma-70 family RNA polymerase sigma factor [Planctomycetota bacterium]